MPRVTAVVFVRMPAAATANPFTLAWTQWQEDLLALPRVAVLGRHGERSITVSADSDALDEFVRGRPDLGWETVVEFNKLGHLAREDYAEMVIKKGKG